MGKSLKGKELGSGLSQRKDGRYQAKYYIPGSPKPKYLYDRNLAKLKKNVIWKKQNTFWVIMIKRKNIKFLNGLMYG